MDLIFQIALIEYISVPYFLLTYDSSKHMLRLAEYQNFKIKIYIFCAFLLYLN